MTSATALVLLHRFWSRCRQKQDLIVTAMACVLIACKVEESVRSIKDIVLVTDRILKLNKRKSNESIEVLGRNDPVFSDV